MDGTNGLKETMCVTALVASNTLSVNIFTAPGKAMVGEHDAVMVDAMTTVAEAEALADWVALHNRNLESIYITHGHFDHFYGLYEEKQDRPNSPRTSEGQEWRRV